MSDTEYFFYDIEKFDFPENRISESVSNLITKEFKSSGDINIIFCKDDYLLDINQKYLNHSYFTDIITFNYVNENTISGDLFISVERVRENAEIFGVDFEEELIRVIFHGILHLTGYEDSTDDQQSIMRSKENYYLEEYYRRGSENV